MLDLVIAAISVVSSLFLGLFVFLNNRKSATNVYFAILIFCNGFYTLFNYLVLNSGSNNDAFFWTKLVMSAAIPVGPSFYFFVKAFPGKKFIFNGIIQLLIAIWMATNILLDFAGLIFSSVDLKNAHLNLHPGSLIASFALMQVTTITIASWVLIRKYQKSIGKLKLQLRYITYGILVSFGLTLLSTVVLPLVFGVTLFISISPLFLLIAEVAIAYSIVRHSLLDFRLVVARSVAYTLLIGLVGGFYSLSLFVVGAQIFGISVGAINVIINGGITLVVVFTFQFFKKSIEKWTDKLFFKGFYDSQELLKSINFILSTNIELNNLTNQILDRILNEMRITKGVFVLLNKDQKQIEYIIQKGFNPLPKFQIYDIYLFLSSLGPFFFDYIDEGSFKDLMRVRNISSILPLVVKDNKIGVLLLGEKASGEIYSKQDTDLLEIIAPELSIALQNSKEYEEIKRFNVTLREEVNRATSQLKVANTKLEELDRLKDDFVSIASHELRTPMTAIRSYSWMALHRSDIPLSDKMKRYLERTLLSTERLINLVNDMLNISRIESGRVEISPRPFNIQNLSQETLMEVDVKAKEKNVHLQILPGNFPPVFADPDKVHQVLLNLIGNALKFTPQDGFIAVSFFTDGQMLDVSIRDNGVGISKDDQSRLFSKFGRLDNSYVAAATSGGTGLGLYICKNLIELMRGKIWATSEGPGMGSTFTFSLPVANQQVLQNAASYTRKPQGEVKGLESVAI